MKEVTVIIPTYKPNEEFLELLNMLKKQTVIPASILVLNTEETYWDAWLKRQNLKQEELLERYPNLRVLHIAKEAFDHAATRNLGIRQAKTEYVLLMTMDAIAADSHLIEALLAPFEESDQVAVSYARQLPKEDCFEIERYTRRFNYPKESCLKTKEDLERLGIKTFFCSDVCALYKKSVYESLGGFVEKAIFNEDMIYAAKAILAGYGIYYAADAKVFHSHNYTGKQQFHRNFDLGVSQAEYPELFEAYPSESEGMKMVKQTTLYLLKKGKPFQIFRLVYQSGCKYLGYRMGKRYQKLGKKIILRCTSNPSYWN